MELVQAILLASMTFVIGALVGLLYKYSDIVDMKADIRQLKEILSVMNVVELSANVKVMKDSSLFAAPFLRKISIICAEYDHMREQIESNEKSLTTIEANLSQGIRVNIGGGKS